MKVYTLEGERYKLGIPYVDMVRAVVNTPHFYKPPRELFFSKEPERDNLGRTIGVEHGKHKVMFMTKIEKENVRTFPFDATMKACYRPMLQAINRDGLMEKIDAPDGYTTSGFTFRVNGEPVKVPKDYAKTLVYNGETLTIGDSVCDPEYDLKWVYACGMLICDRPLVRSIKYIELLGGDLV